MTSLSHLSSLIQTPPTMSLCPCGEKAAASGLCADCDAKDTSDSDEESETLEKLKGKPSLETVIACMRMGSRIIQAGKKQLRRLQDAERKLFTRGVCDVKGWDVLKDRITFITNTRGKEPPLLLKASEAGQQNVSAFTNGTPADDSWKEPTGGRFVRCLLPHTPTAKDVLYILRPILDGMSTDESNLVASTRYVELKRWSSKLLPSPVSELYPKMSRFVFFVYDHEDE